MDNRSDIPQWGSRTKRLRQSVPGVFWPRLDRSMVCIQTENTFVQMKKRVGKYVLYSGIMRPVWLYTTPEVYIVYGGY